MEYLILVLEYFIVKGFKSFLFNALICLIVGVLIYHCSNDSIYNANASNLHSTVLNVIGILIGFSISIFTVLLTINHSNIDKAKNHKLGKKFLNKDFNLHDSVLIGFAFVILLLSTLLVFNFVYPLIIDIETLNGKLAYSVNISILIFAIISLMRNVLDFYFILSK